MVARESWCSVRRILSALLAFVLILGFFPPPRPSRAALDVTGDWSDSTWSWNGHYGLRYAIHLVLLRGDSNPWHSRILYWAGDNTAAFRGGEFGWDSSVASCDVALPGTVFDTTTAAIPSASYNVFCAGHTPLAKGTGHLLISGGNQEFVSEFGTQESQVLQRATGTSVHTWTNPGSMTEWRW